MKKKNISGGIQGGYFISLQSDGKFTPPAWSSRNLRRIARSTLAAEALPMVDSMDNTGFIFIYIL